MSKQEIGVVDGWVDVSDDEFNSTVAIFAGGAKCVADTDSATFGDKVLIWQGVSEVVEDERGNGYEVTHFEGYGEVPEEAEYVIEIQAGDESDITNSRFAQDISEAKEIAREEVQKITTGGY